MAFDNISAFHRAQQGETLSVETMPGVTCRRMSRPIGQALEQLLLPCNLRPLNEVATNETWLVIPGDFSWPLKLHLDQVLGVGLWDWNVLQGQWACMCLEAPPFCRPARSCCQSLQVWRLFRLACLALDVLCHDQLNRGNTAQVMLPPVCPFAQLHTACSA